MLPLLLSGCATVPKGTTPHAEVLLKTSTSWNGAPLPPYPSGTPEITLTRITIPPGAKLPVHKHGVVNAGVLLSGQLTVMSSSGQSVQLKAGDALSEVVETWHRGENTGRVPAVILVCYVGSPALANTTLMSPQPASFP